MLQHLFNVRTIIERRFPAFEPYLYGALAALAYLEAGPETAFIYFQF
jgi:alginate O-acetyltransferase complex protein AlgI